MQIILVVVGVLVLLGSIKLATPVVNAEGRARSRVEGFAFYLMLAIGTVLVYWGWAAS